MSAAPYHDDVASGPPGGHAVWAEASDGVRLRVGLWPEGGRGTVVIFPGRTEYVEKYSAAAATFHGAGFASAAIDWRGQGLTARPAANRLAGHVESFREYQRDAEAMIGVLREAGLPEPFHLLAHSMGGLIGLRAAIRGLPFARLAFSAPMWGLPLTTRMRTMAWIASHTGHALGLGERTAPGTGKAAEPTRQSFEGNLLTNDRGTFDWMKAQVIAHPDLALGAPSLAWLRAALREKRALRALPSPSLPALTLLGGDEAIVSGEEICTRMARWPNGRLEELPGLRHEVLMEAPEIRARIFAMLIAHFDTHD